MTTTPDIEAVKAALLDFATSGRPYLPSVGRYHANTAIATITALQTRVDEAERERDHQAWMVSQLTEHAEIDRNQLAAAQAEAEALRKAGNFVAEDADRYLNERDDARDQLAAAQAEVARLDAEAFTMQQMRELAQDHLGCEDVLDALEELDQARNQLATLRAAIAEALSCLQQGDEHSARAALRNLDQPEGEDDNIASADNIAKAMASYCRQHGFRQIKLTLTNDGGWVCNRNVHPEEDADQPEPAYKRNADDAIAAASLMKDRAIEAHRICKETMQAYPEIPELGHDGALHDAIHKIVGVDTPWYVGPHADQPEGEGKRYRHVKRGTIYTVIGEGKLQCSANPLLDDQPIVVYRGEDGQLWARGVDEFHDGRFVPASQPEGEGEGS